MQTLNQPVNPLTEMMPVQPAVTLIVPFEPHLRTKAEVMDHLLGCIEKAIEQVREKYQHELARLIENRLKQVVQQLNFSSYKKGVAIFVSPVFEKLLYLPFQVEPFLSVAASFNIQQVVLAKKQQQSFLLVNLSRYSSNIFLEDGQSLSRVNMNMRDESDKPIVFPKSKSFSDRNEMRELLLQNFLRRTDQALQLLLKVYPLPVVVTGSPKVIGEFRKISVNGGRIVSYIHGHFAKADQQSLKHLSQSILQEWEVVRHKDLMQRISLAMNANHLASGIHDVWKNARAQNASLLVLEENYSPAAILQPARTNTSSHAGLLIKNTVDEIIEKVLESGGDVEIVKPGTLAGYEPIVLIERYASKLRS